MNTITARIVDINTSAGPKTKAYQPPSLVPVAHFRNSSMTPQVSRYITPVAIVAQAILWATTNGPSSSGFYTVPHIVNPANTTKPTHIPTRSSHQALQAIP